MADGNVKIFNCFGFSGCTTSDLFDADDEDDIDFDSLDDSSVGESGGIDPDLDVLDDSDAVMIGDDQDDFD